MKFISTEKLCETYDVEKDFFLRRKKSDEFVKNIHYIQKGNTLRWNFDKVLSWWKDEEFQSFQVDSILNKVMSN